jgi:hypothetical protein
VSPTIGLLKRWLIIQMYRDNPLHLNELRQMAWRIIGETIRFVIRACAKLPIAFLSLAEGNPKETGRD